MVFFAAVFFAAGFSSALAAAAASASTAFSSAFASTAFSSTFASAASVLGSSVFTAATVSAFTVSFFINGCLCYSFLHCAFSHNDLLLNTQVSILLVISLSSNYLNLVISLLLKPDIVNLSSVFAEKINAF